MCSTFSFLFPLCSFYTNVRRNILHAIIHFTCYYAILLYSFPFCTCINVFLLINTCLYIQMCRRSFFYTKLSTNTFLYLSIFTCINVLVNTFAYTYQPIHTPLLFSLCFFSCLCYLANTFFLFFFTNCR